MQVVTLIHEENGAYGVSFPDFPGCTTVGANADEALAKAAEVLAFHVGGMREDGLELPVIRSIAELRDDPAFRDDAEGAVIAFTPLTPPTCAVRVNITIEESLLVRTDRAAQAEGMTRSAFIAAAINRRLAAWRE